MSETAPTRDAAARAVVSAAPCRRAGGFCADADRGTPCARPEARLRAVGLRAGHGGRTVLADVDLQFEPGRVSVLIGPNGSGKSTLLKTLARQLEPLGGSVLIDTGGPGRGAVDIRSVGGGDLARIMASVFTEGRRPDLLTCRDVVEAGRYPFTGTFGGLRDRDRAAVDRAMGLMGVAAFADNGFSQVSDGQRQRVVLARAIAQEPAILILDEPTSYLDVRHQLDLIGVLRRLAHEEGVCVVLSLHELALAQRAADRVVAVADGRIVEAGSPDQVFTPDKIGRLYGFGDVAHYDPVLGGIEIATRSARPRAFVIAGGGSGAETFRRLQREGVPFATGVLHEGDVDCVLGRDLGARVVATPPFGEICDDAFKAALSMLDEIVRDGGAVIDCSPPYGPMNARNRDLVECARALGALAG